MDIIYEDGNSIIESFSVPRGVIISSAIFVLAVILAFYVLRSIGIYKLAVNQGIDKAFMAFIPCVWIFVACKLLGKIKFFGVSFEQVALIVCIVFSCCQVVPFVYNFLRLFPYFAYYLEGGSLTLSVGRNIVLSAGSNFNNIFDTDAVNILLRILNVTSYFLNIAEVVILVFLYISIFKMFWPQHYILASVLSFLGLFPVFVFAIRNNKPVNFVDYMRSKFYGYRQGGYGPGGYGNGGYGNGGYGNGGYGNGAGNNGGTDSNGNVSEDPFSEFSEKQDEPFSEFNGGDKDADKKDDE